ncbi:Hypothetical predicted protein [Octopus vulgaris]|uniref:CABIT domain-containing protein n=1 Tax=Octopus vulgaris TaxID=6645 RepID=A0AA36F5K1_OCTVU|nr:Hypothetical predicted protein [Octopus vulgaris]
MPSKFFTCTPLTGMSIVKKDNSKSKYIQKGVRAGSTLTIDSIFTAKWETEAETGFFKKTKIKYTLAEQKYLKCLDPHKEVVYIPLSAEGRFYTFYEQGKTGRHVVYRINEFSREFEFPLKVRLIYGTSPVRNVKFTDLLTLNKVEEIETIVACSIGLDKHHLIDIPIKTGVYFKLQHFENVTESNESNLKAAMAFSRKYVHHYQRRIRQSMEYDETYNDNFTDQQQDGAEIPFDLLKDLSIDKHDDRDVKVSISNFVESSVV